MKYLIDSDWVADYLNGVPAVVQEVLSLAVSGVAISLITYGEIFEGIYHGRDPKEAEAHFAQFLRVVRVLPLNRAILRRFAQIRGELRRQGMLIADMDNSYRSDGTPPRSHAPHAQCSAFSAHLWTIAVHEDVKRRIPCDLTSFPARRFRITN